LIDHVILAKTAIVGRCLQRIADRYPGREQDLETDLDLQDIVMLNLQRACEATIDMANRALTLLGQPPAADSRDAFFQLNRLRVIDGELAGRLYGMVGFRNRLVHQYQEIDLDRVRAMLANNLNDLTDFGAIMIDRFGGKSSEQANPGT